MALKWLELAWFQAAFSYLTQRNVISIDNKRIKQMAEREGVTEKLKAENQMEWVALMNNIRSRATETVNTDLIYT